MGWLEKRRAFLWGALVRGEVEANFPSGKEGWRERPAKVPQSRRSAKKAGKCRALKSAGRGEGYLRKVSTLYHADSLLKGDQLLAGLADVRPAFQQPRSNPRGGFRGIRILGQPPPTRASRR